MNETNQFAMNVALLRCIMENNKMVVSLMKGLSTGWSAELEAQVLSNNESYTKALEKCFDLLEKAAP